MATFSKFNQRPIQLMNIRLYKKESNNCFLGTKKIFFSITPSKIVHKIHLTTSFDNPLKPKINFDVYIFI